jgi:hypothetical protein
LLNFAAVLGLLFSTQVLIRGHVKDTGAPVILSSVIFSAYLAGTRSIEGHQPPELVGKCDVTEFAGGFGLGIALFSSVMGLLWIVGDYHLAGHGSASGLEKPVDRRHGLLWSLAHRRRLAAEGHGHRSPLPIKISLSPLETSDGIVVTSAIRDIGERKRSEEGLCLQRPPDIREKLEALKKLEMGKVMRMTLRFRQRFWDTISASGNGRKTLSEMGFPFSEDEWFPTWWTTIPNKLPIITGWTPFRCAERLSGNSRTFVIVQCLRTLATLLHIGSEQLAQLLDAAYFHDWQTNPFSRGAYSYDAVSSDDAQQTLATPVENTLFFAGEATDATGHNGTVHGAIASGRRAAREILLGFH